MTEPPTHGTTTVAQPDHTTNNNSNNTGNSSIRLVVQRYRQASLLVDENTVVTVGGGDEGGGGASSSASWLLGNNNTNHGESDGTNSPNHKQHIGMLVYVSFAKTATASMIPKAAQTVLNLPIQTAGAWGDGSDTQSIVKAAADRYQPETQASHEPSSSSVSILLVPQANLIAKVKKNGKSVQYRDQIDKTAGEALFGALGDAIEALLIHEQEACRGNPTGGGGTPAAKPLAAASNNNNNSVSVDPSVPPEDYFRRLLELQAQAGIPLAYGSLDPDTGLPMTAADGSPLTKSANKRVQKLVGAHAKKHEKFRAKQPNASEAAASPIVPAVVAAPAPSLDPAFVRLVRGSFGKRQGLTLASDMGPFCHVIDL